jgi:GT2 family glycosyltransferase
LGSLFNIKEKHLENTIRLSVVSHDQDDLVYQLLASISRYCLVDQLHVTVVRNTQTSSKLLFEQFPFPVTVLQNSRQKGFGANHNQSFTTCQEDFFCVLNPDILFTSNIFNGLMACFSGQDIGVVAPALIDSDGRLQDSARRYPSPRRIFQRVALSKKTGRATNLNSNSSFPDWVAGMFMLFPAHIYREIGGFDEHFFMYCEDADICKRLALLGYKTQLVCQAQAIHNARRASHRTFQHLRWHISSLLRFFIKYPFYTL